MAKKTYFSKRIQKELRFLSFHYGLISSLALPNVSQIEITNACNFTCPICPHTTGMTRNVEYMSFSFFKKIIGELYPSNEPIYLHLLGEALMHPDLYKMIHYAKREGYEIGLFTNGSLLTEEASKKIIDEGLDYLVFSFEIIEETFNRLRKGGNFDLVRENIIRFLELRRLSTQEKPRVTISSITLPGDEEKMEKASRLWIGKVDKFVQKGLHDWSGDIVKITGIAGRKKITQKICLLPWLRMAVLVDGRVAACCVDYDGNYILGDLKRDSLKSIWKGEKMVTLRKALLERRKDAIRLCSKCTLGSEVKGMLRNRLHLLYRSKSLINRLARGL